MCRCGQFLFGGLAYGLLEILWRGYTHFSMLILGGCCFLYIMRLSCQQSHLAVLSAKSCLFITAMEFLAGYLVNMKLHWNVWDYSNMPINILGQICLPYTAIWFCLSMALIPICRQVKKHYYARKNGRLLLKTKAS